MKTSIVQHGVRRYFDVKTFRCTIQPSKTGSSYHVSNVPRVATPSSATRWQTWFCLQDGQSSILPVPHGVSSRLRCRPLVRPLLRSIRNQSVIKLLGLFKDVVVWPPAPWGRCGYGMGPFISGSELQNFNHISCRFMYLLRKDEWSSAPEQWSSSPVIFIPSDLHPQWLLQSCWSKHSVTIWR